MQDDTESRRPLSHTTVARLLLEVSHDPRLRILFGLPPKEGVSAVAPGNTRKTIASLESESMVVMFPVVARPRAYLGRGGSRPRRHRAVATEKPPKKK